MEENTYVGITLIMSFYVNDTFRQVFDENLAFRIIICYIINLREKILTWTRIRTRVIAPARKAGDPGSNPGPGENFFY